jgi:uncharacterized SAM-binding protein YcdF (DUF218 family)
MTASLLSHSSQRFGGIFNRRERWGLSALGWLLIVITVVAMVILFVFGAYSFLAVTHRVSANVLVVEGWIHEYAIRAAVEEFNDGHYRQVFTTGGPEVGTGGYINDYNTSASVGGELLKKDGIPSESLQIVPSRVMDRDRTYASAVALRNWFREQNMPVRNIDILTEDLHARRTRLLFHKALGNNIDVGIIAVPNPDYDSRHWWRYSEGVKDVFSEAAAYLYAKFLFHPSVSSGNENRATISHASR